MDEPQYTESVYGDFIRQIEELWNNVFSKHPREVFKFQTPGPIDVSILSNNDLSYYLDVDFLNFKLSSVLRKNLLNFFLNFESLIWEELKFLDNVVEKSISNLQNDIRSFLDIDFTNFSIVFKHILIKYIYDHAVTLHSFILYEISKQLNSLDVHNFGFLQNKDKDLFNIYSKYTLSDNLNNLNTLITRVKQSVSLNIINDKGDNDDLVLAKYEQSRNEIRVLEILNRASQNFNIEISKVMNLRFDEFKNLASNINVLELIKNFNLDFNKLSSENNSKMVTINNIGFICSNFKKFLEMRIKFDENSIIQRILGDLVKIRKEVDIDAFDTFVALKNMFKFQRLQIEFFILSLSKISTFVNNFVKNNKVSLIDIEQEIQYKEVDEVKNIILNALTDEYKQSFKEKLDEKMEDRGKRQVLRSHSQLATVDKYTNKLFSHVAELKKLLKNLVTTPKENYRLLKDTFQSTIEKLKLRYDFNFDLKILEVFKRSRSPDQINNSEIEQAVNNYVNYFNNDLTKFIRHAEEDLNKALNIKNSFKFKMYEILIEQSRESKNLEALREGLIFNSPILETLKEFKNELNNKFVNPIDIDPEIDNLKEIIRSFEQEWRESFPKDYEELERRNISKQEQVDIEEEQSGEQPEEELQVGQAKK
ncbi:MAG: hypothetical protein QXG00_02455 [Candidatus Woesearchaeota archaeon]